MVNYEWWIMNEKDFNNIKNNKWFYHRLFFGGDSRLSFLCYFAHRKKIVEIIAYYLYSILLSDTKSVG